MKSPDIKKTRIGSSYYDVKYVKDLKDEKGKLLFGRIWQDQRKIKVDKDCAYLTQLQSLFHENIHGIFWEYTLGDETIVEPLSNGLFAFIMDNPKLVRMILRCAKRIKK